jgi:cytoskeletal protein CcmA (bactofilin family)
MGDAGTAILTTDAANDRVGINTTSPVEALDVSGNTNLRGDTRISGDTFSKGNLGVTGRTFLGTVDTATATASDKILVVQSTGEIESITTSSLTAFTSDYWVGDGSGTGIKPSGTTTNITVDGNITANGNIVGDNSTNISGINTLEVSTVQGQSDDDTKITFTDDDINITAGNVNMLDFTQNDGGQDEITFNEAGADIDVRMEGDTDQNLFFLDAGNDKIAIGTSTVSEALLTVDGETRISGDTFIKDNLGVTGRTSVSTIVVANNLNISGTTRLIDDAKILLGAGEDTQIYQSGSETIIKDAVTGNIKLRAGTVTIQNGAASKTMGVFNGANSVDLYYNNNLKFQTANNGINVTGWVQASTDVNVSGNTNISGTLSAMGNTTLTGDLDVDGTTNLDAVDIDGNVQIDGTLTVGVDDTGYDVKFFGATSGRYLLWDEANDRLKYRDNVKAVFGHGNDLEIYHDATDNHIEATSTLNIATANSGIAVNIGHTTSETTVNDNLTVTGTLDLDSVSTTTPTPTSAERILVKQTSGVVESITKAQLTGLTDFSSVVTYWQGNGSGTGIKPSGTTTNVDVTGLLGVSGKTNIDGVLNLGGGATAAAPTPQLKFSNYYDSTGGPSISHIDLYGGDYGFGISVGDLDYISDIRHRFYSDTTAAAGGTPALTINGENNVVAVNMASASYELDVTGDIRINSGALGVGVNPNGTDGRIDASNDVVAYSSSDKRWKENIQPIENALDKVSQISGVEFDWKKLTKEEKKTQHGNEGHDIGVIAQEIEKVLPEIVTTRENGYKGVRYEKIVPLLIESIKELKAEIEELKNK